jgi:hypothetical protein
LVEEWKSKDKTTRYLWVVSDINLVDKEEVLVDIKLDFISARDANLVTGIARGSAGRT